MSVYSLDLKKSYLLQVHLEQKEVLRAIFLIAIQQKISNF